MDKVAVQVRVRVRVRVRVSLVDRVRWTRFGIEVRVGGTHLAWIPCDGGVKVRMNRLPLVLPRTLESDSGRPEIVA